MWKHWCHVMGIILGAGWIGSYVIGVVTQGSRLTIEWASLCGLVAAIYTIGCLVAATDRRPDR